ncbi:Hypothetical protein D9617_56g096220 [Elsinoe fawcettii]|nr:Hypothetical protein D9617_56g096220 [Elsinoe fawcettii]
MKGVRSPSTQDTHTTPPQCKTETTTDGSKAKRSPSAAVLEAKRQEKNRRRRERRALRVVEERSVKRSLITTESLPTSLLDTQETAVPEEQGKSTKTKSVSDLEQLPDCNTSSVELLTKNMKQLAYRFAVITQKQQTLLQGHEKKIKLLESSLQDDKSRSERLEQIVQDLSVRLGNLERNSLLENRHASFATGH